MGAPTHTLANSWRTDEPARRLRLALTLAVALALVLWSGAARAEERIALVIGNADYEVQSWRLANPIRDARLMRDALVAQGFDVDLVENASRSAMDDAFRRFGRRLRTAGDDAVTFVYFSGHGVQSRGYNYLLPVDADARTEQDVWDQAPRISQILDHMADVGNAVNLVVLDACRDNPLRSEYRSLSRGGLGEIPKAPNALIAYAAAPGQTAADGAGQNSPYTTVLAQAVREAAGQRVTALFEDVAAQVFQKTGGQQLPEFRATLVRAPGWALGSGSATPPSPPPAASPPPATTPGPPATTPAPSTTESSLARRDLERQIALASRGVSSEEDATDALRQVIASERPGGAPAAPSDIGAYIGADIGGVRDYDCSNIVIPLQWDAERLTDQTLRRIQTTAGWTQRCGGPSNAYEIALERDPMDDDARALSDRQATLDAARAAFAAVGFDGETVVLERNQRDTRYYAQRARVRLATSRYEAPRLSAQSIICSERSLTLSESSAEARALALTAMLATTSALGCDFSVFAFSSSFGLVPGAERERALSARAAELRSETDALAQQVRAQMGARLTRGPLLLSSGEKGGVTVVFGHHDNDRLMGRLGVPVE